jgi:dihydroorotate dehydrogenase
MYRILFSLVLSKLDPERAHHLAFLVIKALPALGVGRLVRRFTRPDPSLAVDALGLRFDSPFGVAAGFDKDGEGVVGLGQLGFGHVEVGTLTARAQPGNEQPRLFRLIPDRAVINRMGFNNHGAAAAAERLGKVAAKRHRPVLGVNIGKSRVVAVEDATADYLESARALAPVADYLVVNVSSPNTPGLRDLQAVESLRPILAAVRAQTTTPVLVKIAPDLSDSDVDEIADLAVELGLAGIVATNTTVSRDGLITPGVAELGAGGVSGAPVAQRSAEVLRRLYQRVGDRLVLISVGGIETADDAWERITAGASLLQGYTGFVYGGGLWAKHIHDGLAQRLHDGGFESLADAVGSATR